MQVDIISTPVEFSKLESSWNAIYDADPEAQFFLSWEWLSQVFLHNKKGWFILAVRLDNTTENYVAFFPLKIDTLMSKRTQHFYNVIRVAGRYTWSDYAGLLCHPNHQDQAIPLLSAKLTEMNWRDISLKNLLISQQRLKLFVDQFNPETFSHEYHKRDGGSDNINLLVCPYIDLPDDYEVYLAQKLSANTRQKVRRYLRKAEASDDMSITLSTPQTYQRDVGFLINFWKDKWKKRKGDKTNRLAKRYREILDIGFKSNTLFMPVLWKDDKPVGVLGTFIDRRKKQLLYFIAGRDEQCNNPPPGLILHAYSIRWAIENGFKEYDFLRGDEQFKYSFGSTDREILYLTISTRSGSNLNGKLNSFGIDDVLRKATRYQLSGQTKKAETGFQQILEIDPNNETALRRSARLHYHQHNFDNAKNIYQQLIEVSPYNADAWHGLGKSLLALELFDSAEQAIRKAITLQSNYPISNHYYLGRILQKQNKNSEAETEFSSLLMLKANNSADKRKQKMAKDILSAD